MRKLSKKISMLMVLAMLVSLFSGVVSASAASSWSFANKTDDVIVAVKETIEMEKNQFADFDLYKDGKAFDTDVYTVKYVSSDEDVVWVDAKNGKLRADKFEKAEAGDTATISALIENKNTGAKTTKSFKIEIAADEEYTLTVTVGNAVLGAETLVAGKDYALTATVVNGDGEAVEATVAYTLDGAAIEKLNVKAGEYTVVATATVDGEVVATEKYAVVAVAEAPEFVALKQTSLTSVEIKLNNADWAKKLADNSALLKYSYLAGDIEIESLVKSVAVKEGAADTVVVEVYDAEMFITDTTYKFGYAGYDCAITFVGDNTVASSLKVVGGPAPAGKEWAMDVAIYNANGVDISKKDGIKDAVTYEVGETSDCNVYGNTIYFFEVGKNAVVKATLDMGWDTETGEEITDISGTGVYNSISAVTYTNLNGYLIGGNTVDDNKDHYSSAGLKMSLSDLDKYIYAKYTKNEFKNQWYTESTTKFIGNGCTVEDTYPYQLGFTYTSTNPSVLMVVEETGELFPASVGTASIVIKAKTYDANWDVKEVVIGSVVVRVEDFRKLTTFTARVDDKKLSANLLLDGKVDETAIIVDAKDQLGDGYGVTYSYELVNQEDTKDYTDYIQTLDRTSTWKNNRNEIAVKVQDDVNAVLSEGKVKTVTIKITAVDNFDGNNKKTATVSFYVKNMDDGVENKTDVKVAKTVLDVSATNVDMKLNKWGADAYDVTARLVLRDSQDYDMGYQPFNYILDTADAATGNNEYSLYIQKDSATWAKGQRADGAFIVNTNNDKITFNPVTLDGTTLVKTAKDSYTIKIFKGINGKAQNYTSKTVKFTDSTSGITVKVLDTHIKDTFDPANPSGEAIGKNLEFYRDGVKLQVVGYDAVTTTDVGSQMVGNADHRVYVRKMKIYINTKEFTWQLDGKDTLEEVTIGQLFTFNQ